MNTVRSLCGTAWDVVRHPVVFVFLYLIGAGLFVATLLGVLDHFWPRGFR